MKRKYWTLEEIEFLKNNYSIFGFEYCSNHLNRSKHSVLSKANKLGVKIDYSIVSEIKGIKVSDSWENGNKIQYLKNNLSTILKTDLYDINEDFSYVLGYLWGDGNLNSGGIGKQNYITLEINSDDGDEIKEKMMSVIDWNISYRQRKNRKKQICFKINNRLLVDYFLEFDYDKKSYISPTKILNLIPEKNRKYFYLGLSDADGCVYINRKRGNYQYSISSTFEQDWAHMVDIFDCLDIRYNILKIERKNKSGNYNKYSQIRITNKKDVIKFLDYLYSTNFKGLKRKHRKYMIINTFLRYTKKEIKERKKRMIDDFLKFALNHIGISKEEFDKFVEDLKAGKIESYNNI